MKKEAPWPGKLNTATTLLEILALAVLPGALVISNGPPSRIPTGFRLKAQGCDEGETLGSSV